MSGHITVEVTEDEQGNIEDVKIVKGYVSPDLVERIIKDPACAGIVDDFINKWKRGEGK